MSNHETVQSAEAYKKTFDMLKANPGKLADLIIAAINLPISTADRNLMNDYMSDMLSDCYGQGALEAETIIDKGDDEDGPYDPIKEHGTYRVIAGSAA